MKSWDLETKWKLKKKKKRYFSTKKKKKKIMWMVNKMVFLSLSFRFQKVYYSCFEKSSQSERSMSPWPCLLFYLSPYFSPLKKKQKRWPSARRNKEGPMQMKLPVSSALSFLIFLTSVSCESLPVRFQAFFNSYSNFLCATS